MLIVSGLDTAVRESKRRFGLNHGKNTDVVH